MSWTIEQIIPTFAVPQIDAGIEHYSRLGFECEWKWPEDAPTHAGLVFGSCSIMLAQCDSAVRADIYFIVSDVSACHESILAGRPWELAHTAGTMPQRPNGPPAQSLHPPKPPAATDYGLRDFSIVDPWGNHLTFGQEIHHSESN